MENTSSEETAESQQSQRNRQMSDYFMKKTYQDVIAPFLTNQLCPLIEQAMADDLSQFSVKRKVSSQYIKTLLATCVQSVSDRVFKPGWIVACLQDKCKDLFAED